MTEAGAWRVILRGVGVIFALVVVVFLITELRSLLVQLALAVLLAAAANPIVEWMTTSKQALGWRWRPPRGLAALLVFVAGLLVLVLGAVVVLATVGPDVSALAASSPLYVAQAQAAIQAAAGSNPDLAARFSGAVPSLQDIMAGAIAVLAQAPRLLSVATGVLGGVVYLLFTLILALYLTIDGDRIRRYLIQLLPFDRQEQALAVTERIGKRLGAWARGEAVLGLIIGVLTWLAALILGLPYAGALALIAAVGELVPNLGPFIAAIPLVVVGFIASPTQGLLALGAAVLIQQLENNLIAPRVMSRAVDIHPVAVIVAILAGNELLGIMGAVLAVPLVASISVIVHEIQRERLARRLAPADEAASLTPPLSQREREDDAS
jgi:predicted PurR-regulated permease PerM